MLIAACAVGSSDKSQSNLLLENCRLIDGTGRPAVENARIVFRGDRIVAAGPAPSVTVPGDAKRIDLHGRTVMPGLIDCHFHIEQDPKMALRQLANGVTSFRDPGSWFDQFDELKRMMAADDLAGPRMQICGPHIDGENPAYPKDSVVARDVEEARLFTERNIRQGAEAIKIYFRLPLERAKAVIEVCRKHNVPTTAHLEILDARDAIRAGVNGIEHISSFGQCLVNRRRAEVYRQTILKDNAARGKGRYELFAEADSSGPNAKDLFQVLREKRPFVTPTLAVFEVRAGRMPASLGAEFEPIALSGFENMKRMTKLVHHNGAQIVLGGHTAVPFAGRGEAPWRELELLVECGLTPLEVIQAATINGARFLRKERDVGSIVPGKLADLIVVDGRPDQAISDIRKISRVMLGGKWLDRPRYSSY
jgi:imidazolonepropionase-like amidohydrolase